MFEKVQRGIQLRTEEDGVDEAGSTTQSPFITAPQLLDSDPDVEDGGGVTDNGSMSSSRSRSGSSRSGATGAGASRTQATPRADANGTTANGTTANGTTANGTTGKDDTKSEALAEPQTEAAKPAKPAKPAPMPADGVTRPSFTPATSSAPSAKPAPSVQPSPSPSAEQSPSTEPGSGYQQPSAYSPPSYSRSPWSTAQDAAATSTSTTTTTTADPVGYRAPTGTNGTQSAPSNGGFSAGVAGAAAAGLANSVTSAFRGTGSKPKSEAKVKSAPRVKVRRSNKRQAMLTLSRLEPWSVMKFSFVASVVAFIILFVAVAVLYMVLSALGVFDSLQHQVSSITSSQSSAGTNISHWFSASLILGYTAMLGALNIVLITALSTIGSVIYNLIAKTVGGIEVTLKETD
jgi:Transmembrane domain of unknown function (DUF3566)